MSNPIHIHSIKKLSKSVSDISDEWYYFGYFIDDISALKVDKYKTYEDAKANLATADIKTEWCIYSKQWNYREKWTYKHFWMKTTIVAQTLPKLNTEIKWNYTTSQKNISHNIQNKNKSTNLENTLISFSAPQ